VWLKGHGVGPNASRTAARIPTEGLFHLREYQAGDDVRRIHWTRSAAAGELIVRLPDELPPDRPRVRLVLDTYFPEASVLSCDAPAEVLDRVVAVWLALGRALADYGARVTLVTAVPGRRLERGAGEPEVVMKAELLSLRDPAAAQRLGAQASWQGRLTVDALLTDEVTYVVSRGLLTHPPDTDKIRWILVPPPAEPELPALLPSAVTMPHPMGSSDNRWTRRKRLIAELSDKRVDYMSAFLALRANVAPAPAGRSFIATPLADGTFKLEALS
jgi:uncharacterized protein (DUF58 family)